MVAQIFMDQVDVEIWGVGASHRAQCRIEDVFGKLALPPLLSHWTVHSEGLSDALQLALLARSTLRRSSSLARVRRCGLCGADARASR